MVLIQQFLSFLYIGQLRNDIIPRNETWLDSYKGNGQALVDLPSDWSIRTMQQYDWWKMVACYFIKYRYEKCI